MRYAALLGIAALLAESGCSSSPIRSGTRDAGANDVLGKGPEVATSDHRGVADLSQVDAPLGADAGKADGLGSSGGAGGTLGGTGGVGGETATGPSSVDGAIDLAALGGRGGTGGGSGATGGTNRDSGATGGVGGFTDGGGFNVSSQCKGGIPCRIPEACGDGVNNQAGIEQCDDGNVLPGDGCNGACKVEPNWTCPLQGPCMPNLVCGDGIRSAGEVCDDGNTKDGDGCSADCVVQDSAYTCVPGQACVRVATCGNQRVDWLTETCDDGNTKGGDGCSANCVLERGWTCPKPGSPCIPSPRCGNGILEASIGEVCDDGNRNDHDGCSADCKVKVAACTCPPGELCSCPPGTCGIGANPCPSQTCGNGIVEGSEDCDDGASNVNTTDPGQAYNGCTASCKRGGFCDDGQVNGSEQCDGYVNNGTYGPNHSLSCNPDCTYGPRCGDGIVQTEYGEECEPTMSDDPQCTNGCRVPGGCGDMIVQPPEQCDDGAYNSGEYGHCAPSCVHAPYCGDGVKYGPEECDDGILDGSYGSCTRLCDLAPHCGDEFTTGPEECDDGPYNGRNGSCTASCKRLVYMPGREGDIPACLPTVVPDLDRAIGESALGGKYRSQVCECFSALSTGWITSLTQLFATATPEEISDMLTGLTSCCRVNGIVSRYGTPADPSSQNLSYIKSGNGYDICAASW